MFKPGDPVSVHILNRDKSKSIALPAIVTSAPELTTFTRRNGSQVATSVVEVISQRQRLDAKGEPTKDTYLRRSTEQLGFISRRFTAIPGFDGASLQSLEEALGADIASFQVSRNAELANAF